MADVLTVAAVQTVAAALITAQAVDGALTTAQAVASALATALAVTAAVLAIAELPDLTEIMLISDEVRIIIISL